MCHTQYQTIELHTSAQDIDLGKVIFYRGRQRNASRHNMGKANAGKRDKESYFSTMPKKVLRILNTMTE